MVLVVLDRDAIGHLDPADTLLSQEVTDLDALAVTSKNKVNREMGVYGAHLVLEAQCDTLDHVSHGSLGGTEASQVLAATMPNNELELRALGAGDKADVHGHVAQVLKLAPLRAATTYLLQLTSRALDSNDTRVNLDSHVLGNIEIQVLVDGKHRGLLCFGVSSLFFKSVVRRGH